MKKYCPVCKSELSSRRGDKVDSNNGFTLWCPNPDCSAQEVSAHGESEIQAYYILERKYTWGKMGDE